MAKMAAASAKMKMAIGVINVRRRHRRNRRIGGGMASAAKISSMAAAAGKINGKKAKAVSFGGWRSASMAAQCQ
jgi:hypothetical protein